ncbi:MAG: DNA integration/recombination/inversion protein [Parcubacteria group bacterium CG10_big_fil_rev_8_21_14_0_10_36_14]|nr:MAG: DNA integration/recombination/inversion protein [Parcubacteria group bacterium CG10_big_fil_rev_8_21_14_0_10_36_14]
MKKILLHICCGPCATHPATVLSQEYEVIGYFYNPNIWPYKEWRRRYEAFLKFCKENRVISDYFPKKPLIEEEYNIGHQKYLDSVKGCEKEPEGGKRCPLCFTMRLDEAAKFASHSLISIFATTLTIGRNKQPNIINPIGQISADKYGINFYEANWKKQDGALKGKKISDEHGLYRQHYCGCEFSIRD